jgi:hypothetical protein
MGRSESTEIYLQGLHSSKGLLPDVTDSPNLMPSKPHDFHSLLLTPRRSELVGRI